MRQLGGDGPAARLGLATLMALPGTPFLYYGEELGMQGGAGTDDREKRTPMRWNATSLTWGFTSRTSTWAGLPVEASGVDAETERADSAVAPSAPGPRRSKPPASPMRSWRERPSAQVGATALSGSSGWGGFSWGKLDVTCSCGDGADRAEPQRAEPLARRQGVPAPARLRPSRRRTGGHADGVSRRQRRAAGGRGGRIPGSGVAELLRFDGPTRERLACVFAGLMLYQPPRD